MNKMEKYETMWDELNLSVEHLKCPTCGRRQALTPDEIQLLMLAVYFPEDTTNLFFDPERTKRMKVKE